MKKLNLLVIGSISTLLLSACNLGNINNANDVQTNTYNNNQFYMSTTATGCRTIAANGGTCTVAVTYYAGNGNSVLGQSLQLTGLSNYTYTGTNGINQCSTVSTTSNTCTFTITSQGSVSNAQTATINVTSQSGYATSFTVGGGM